MTEPNRRAEEAYRARQARERAEMPLVSEHMREPVARFHVLLAAAKDTLERLEYPVPSGLIEYNSEDRLHWILYKQFDENASVHLLADGDVIYRPINSPKGHFDANDLLNVAMKTDMKYWFAMKEKILTSVNIALEQIGDEDAMKNYRYPQFHPPAV